MNMLCLLVTAFIALAWYFFFLPYRQENLSGRLVFSGVFLAGQIVLSEIILGTLGVLSVEWLLPLTLLTSVGLGGWRLAKTPAGRFKEFLCADWQITCGWLKSVAHWENLILGSLFLMVMVLFTFLAYFLPARGTDDLSYHLPPIFEYVIQHKIFILPLKFNPHFSFPLNAEFLYMWPVIFSHSQCWAEYVQWLVTVFGVAVLYSLGRLVGLNAREACFTGLLFLFIPVVLMQAESGYIDTTTSVFFLVSLYFVFKFYLSGESLFLYGAATAMGLFLGMKYMAILLVLPLQYFIFARRPKVTGRQLLTSGFLIFIFGGYFYLRNWWSLGNPIYPIHFLDRSLGVMEGGGTHVDLMLDMASCFYKWHLLYFRDVGLATFNGGFGAVYWGMAFPCWIFILFDSWRKRSRQGFIHFYFWLQPLVGFMILFLAPVEGFRWMPRYAIFAVPLGFLAFGKIMNDLNFTRNLRGTLKSLAIVFSFLSVTLTGVSTQPMYKLLPVLEDILNHQEVSEFKYYSQGTWYLRVMRYAAELLDFLTKEGGSLQCRLVTGSSSFWPASFYGSQLQNRIWNFGLNNSIPDVWIFQDFTDEPLGPAQRIQRAEVMHNPQYVLVLNSPYLQVFIRQNILLNKEIKERLLKYYEQTFPVFIDLDREFVAMFDKDTPVLMWQDFGVGFRYLELKKEIANPVFWVPAELANDVLKQKAPSQIISFEQPIHGCQQKQIAKYSLNGEIRSIFVNKCK